MVSAEEYKKALSMLAAGVTVITTRLADGAKAGFTATAFSALSLEPPMVLFCLDKKAQSHELFKQATHFGVTFLDREQEQLSSLFAKPGEEKFGQVDCKEGLRGAPLLPGGVATLECTVAGRLDGGDHTIYLGTVEKASIRHGQPLVYFDRAYHGVE